MKNKKRNRYMLLLILLLGISLGYALISTTLKINGTANVAKQTWSVYWDEPVVTEGSVSTTAPTREADSGDPENTKLVWTVDLSLPGDYYEFTVDAVNAGTIDAMITSINNTVTPTLPEYIKYDVTYADGIAIGENHLLAKQTGTTPTTEKYKVRVYYNETVATAETINSMTGNTQYTFTFNVTYSQATDEAIIKPAMKLGDYFILVPDATNVSTTVEGFNFNAYRNPTADQTLWRVIDIKSNSQIDAVSEYVSADDFSIGNVIGYKNLVLGLQDLSSCYAKEGYTVATRMMGYDGQTLVIEDTSDFDGTYNPNSNPTISPPSNVSTPLVTTGTGEEYKNGILGDTLYLKDYNLVSNIYKSEPDKYGADGMKAYTKNGYSRTYWLASRRFTYYNSSAFAFSGYYIDTNGALKYGINTRYYNYGWSVSSDSANLRPIITLKADVVINGGDGTLNNPYTFE